MRFLQRNPLYLEVVHFYMIIFVHLYLSIYSMDPQFVFGETKNIADAVLFVSGEEGSFINGASLVVDGGMSCN